MDSIVKKMQQIPPDTETSILCVLEKSLLGVWDFNIFIEVTQPAIPVGKLSKQLKVTEGRGTDEICAGVGKRRARKMAWQLRAGAARGEDLSQLPACM